MKAKPISSAMRLSETPRSFWIGITSRFMICRSRKANISAAAKTPTAYQARAGLGQSVPGSVDAAASLAFMAVPNEKRRARVRARRFDSSDSALERTLQGQVELARMTRLLLDVGLAEAAQVEGIQVIRLVRDVGAAERRPPGAVTAVPLDRRVHELVSIDAAVLEEWAEADL